LRFSSDAAARVEITALTVAVLFQAAMLLLSPLILLLAYADWRRGLIALASVTASPTLLFYAFRGDQRAILLSIFFGIAALWLGFFGLFLINHA
jgi:hypothetical protein